MSCKSCHEPGEHDDGLCSFCWWKRNFPDLPHERRHYDLEQMLHSGCGGEVRFSDMLRPSCADCGEIAAEEVAVRIVNCHVNPLAVSHMDGTE